MVTVFVRLTPLVETAKEALEAPAATVTVGGTEATDELLLVSVTTAPPGGAAPPSLTVPVDVCPPTTPNGFSVKSVKVGGGAGALGSMRNSTPSPKAPPTTVEP